MCLRRNQQHFPVPSWFIPQLRAGALEQEVSGLNSGSANTLASLYLNDVNSKMRMIIVPNTQVCCVHPHLKCVTYQYMVAAIAIIIVVMYQPCPSAQRFKF